MSDKCSTSSCSIGIGNIVAVIISWSVNHSIWWAFWHGVFGWFYVIYYALCIRGH